MKFLSILLMLCIFLVSCNREQTQNIAGTEAPVTKIMLSDAQIQLANIKAIEVHEDIMEQNLELTGVLKVNEESAVSISARADGRIQKLFFKNSGETVNRGDSLYQFYSDELENAQREYFTIQSNNWNYSGRYEPSLVLENKLLLLGMLPNQIAQLRKDGKIMFSVTIFSPFKGIIRSVNTTEGQYVKTGQTLFEMADDNQLWVEAQVYQEDLQFLKVGMPLSVTVPAIGGNIPLKGKISFINPSIQQGKNVTLIRSLIDNQDKNLFPGMLAIINVKSQKNPGIVIPASAVIFNKNESRVWVRNEDGSFSGRIVETGIQSEDSVLILSGLTKSEWVVTSGAYLLNSELILKRGTVIRSNIEM